ncbi:hypothetical protein C8F04DRAFT_1396346 [Mycena alexandri]|uniref:Uncharacterized protein n=1 Tax=Mycena alexandri TaxID=1745969 RepID=A0AAD6X5K1_9AGAR|nr:hypothetical protein C8F04DRAFT_1396346 [Mycena alexandri]
MGPSLQDALREIQIIRKQIRDDNKKREKDIQVFKRRAREDVKEQIVASLRAARKKNASLRIQNLDEGLAVVLKFDGSKGKLFPADLRSLFSYDAANMRDLVKE